MENEFGKRLKAAREEKGLSQLKLAMMAGINQPQVGWYERGEHQPTITTLEWLCGALDMTASDLLGF